MAWDKDSLGKLQRLISERRLWRYVFALGALLVIVIGLEINAIADVGFRPRGAVVAAFIMLVFGSLGAIGMSWVADRVKRRN